ncbi:hypothetical protein IT087_02120 [Candidatus Uhrbacteria bacterium]|nr:hypothetical protein [Candidatus Uhrbacteria bacterium]
MPMRASGKQVGASVGKMLFGGQDAKRIQHRLEKKGGEKLQQALIKRGVTDVDTKDIAKALAGESRGGWSQSRYKQVVAALQDVGMAQKAKSASSMVLKAARNAQQTLDGPHLTPEQIKARLKELARERRSEANAEESEAQMGVLDRMRGAQGRANKVDLAAQEGALLESQNPFSETSSVRDVRDQLRKDLGMQPKIALNKPKNNVDDEMGFQA